VHTPAQLREALRRAEQEEDLRRLRDLVRLVRLAGGRSSDV
jgi:hypothetical protein